MGVSTKLQKSLVIQSDSETSDEQENNETKKQQKQQQQQQQKQQTLPEPQTLSITKTKKNNAIDKSLPFTIKKRKTVQLQSSSSSEDEGDEEGGSTEEGEESSEGEKLFAPRQPESSGEEEVGKSGRVVKSQDDVWVCCDLCKKWRRLSQQQAKKIDKKAPWDCSMNPDRKFSSCKQAQELPDKKIDHLLAMAKRKKRRSKSQQNNRLRRPVVWQCIEENIYTHRDRKQEQEDDIMICSCTVDDEEEGGCYNSDCLNRMLNVECVDGWCPCEDQCHNQRFKNKIYAKLEVRRAGPKGFGLFALHDIKRESFIIEYVGEVLEEEEYHRRAHFYEQTGQRHFYFMNLGNGEVIDAARKGNYARFINHSCEPNCETQKWLVRGELCIGLFAKEDIREGEELTFDYNFDRHGDKPVKCYCGSLGCRGVIGGGKDFLDPNASPSPTPDSQSAEDPEPIMVREGDSDYKSAVVQQILDQEVGIQVSKQQTKRTDEMEKFVKAKGLGEPKEFLTSLENDVNRFVQKQGNNRAQLKAVKRATGDGTGKWMRLKRGATFGGQANGRKRVREANSSSGGATSSGEIYSDGGFLSELNFNAASDRRSGGSEINRRLETLRPLLHQASPTTEVVARFLRLFNLCDITRAQDVSTQNPIGQNLKRAFTGKQKARLADLSMLLDVITGVGHHSSKSQLIKCGVLSQLHHLMRKLLQFEDSQADIMIKKCLKVMDHLPLDAHALHSVRSAQGGFVQLFNILIYQENKDIKRLAINLSSQYPCPPELQLYHDDPIPTRTHSLLKAQQGQGMGMGMGVPLSPGSPGQIKEPNLTESLQKAGNALSKPIPSPQHKPLQNRNASNVYLPESHHQHLQQQQQFLPGQQYSPPPMHSLQENHYPPFKQGGYVLSPGPRPLSPVARPVSQWQSQQQWTQQQRQQQPQLQSQSTQQMLPSSTYMGPGLGPGSGPPFPMGGDPHFQRGGMRPWWQHQQQQQDMWNMPCVPPQDPSGWGYGYPYGSELQQSQYQQMQEQQIQQQQYEQQLMMNEEQMMDMQAPQPPVVKSPSPPHPPPEEALPQSPPPPPAQPENQDQDMGDSKNQQQEPDNPMLPPHLLKKMKCAVQDAPTPPVPPPPDQVLEDTINSDSIELLGRIGQHRDELDVRNVQFEEFTSRLDEGNCRQRFPYDVEHSFSMGIWDWRCLLYEIEEEVDEKLDCKEEEILPQEQQCAGKQDEGVKEDQREENKDNQEGPQGQQEEEGKQLEVKQEDVKQTLESHSPPAKRRRIEQEHCLIDQWSSPDEMFQNFVTSTVKSELQQYQQEGSGYHFTNEDSEQLLRKLSHTVIQKELEAYQIRQKKGISKPILRDKIQLRIQDFIKNSVKRFQVADNHRKFDT